TGISSTGNPATGHTLPAKSHKERLSRPFNRGLKVFDQHIHTMRMIFFSFLLGITTFSSSAQDYLRYYELCNSASYEHNFKHAPRRSLQLLNEAHLLAPLDFEHLELAAFCSLETGDTLKAIDYIRQSVLCGNSDMERIRNFYKGLVSTPYFRQIEQNHLSWQQEYYCNKNVPVVVELAKMVANDQLIRYNHAALKEKEGARLFDKIDSGNIYRVRELYLSYGYLDYPGMFLIYWHDLMNFPEMWKFFEPIMYKAIFTGQFNPGGYAQLVDRIRIYAHNQNSWYGEFTEEGPQLKMGRIDDIDHVDERRKAIGLCTLKEKAEMVKWQLPANYKPH
ncbi:MAG TPA: hypothetical protein VGO45_07005, partial [Bacteroidia bacterium]|nr:hypothetical protein [Bacteroidia bacterium]